MDERATRKLLIVSAVLVMMGFLVAFGIARRGGGTPVNMKSAVLIAIVALGVMFVITAVMGSAMANRRKREEVEAALTAKGYVLHRKPKGDERDRLFTPFEGVKALNTKAKGLKFAATGEVEGHEVTLIEHQYVVSTGQTTAKITHLGAATRCPAWWPGVSLSPEHLLHKIADAFGKRDIQLEREAFNKRWRVKGDDEDHTILLLTPEVQEWLEGAPRHEFWRMGDGWVRCLRRTTMGSTDPGEMGERVATLLSLVPAEALRE